MAHASARLSELTAPEESRFVDTLVVGGGMSGLAYAHGLGPGADVVLLEGGERWGGLVRTRTWEGLHYECGPEALQDNAPETLALIEELGLERCAAHTSAHRRFILLPKGLVDVPTGPGAFLRSPLLSVAGKLRACSEPWRSGSTALDGSMADFVRHRLGQQVLDHLVDPAISGIYAGDPELLSLRASFPSMWELVSEHGSLIRGMFAKLKARKRARAESGEAPKPRRAPELLTVAGGMESLPLALSKALGDGAQLRSPVSHVRRVAQQEALTEAERGAQWVVTTDAPSGAPARWLARQLVLAVPVAAAAAVLREDEPDLSQQLRSMVSEAVISVAHVWPREAVAHPLNGFGYLVPSKAGMTHLGTLFSSSISPSRCPPGQVVLRTLMGGARRPELLELDDETLLGHVRREVGGVLGCSGEPSFTHVARWPVALPRYDLEQVARQDRIDELLAERPGLSIIGNHRRGISVNALIESSRSLAREHRSAHA